MVVQTSLAFQQCAQPQDGRFVEPRGDELDSDRKPLGTQRVGHRKRGQPSQIEGDVAAMTWVDDTVTPSTTCSDNPCGRAVTGVTGHNSTS